MDYVSQNHSKHLLMVHLIFVCKYRKKLLERYGEEIKQIFYNIAEEKALNIVEMEVDKNHIYLSKQFRKKKTFWSDGYFACSIGNVSKETIGKYIQSQG